VLNFVIIKRRSSLLLVSCSLGKGKGVDVLYPDSEAKRGYGGDRIMDEKLTEIYVEFEEKNVQRTEP